VFSGHNHVAHFAFSFSPTNFCAVVSASAAGTFVVGGLFFRHMKRGFADVL
jgi:hypothetical protein